MTRAARQLPLFPDADASDPLAELSIRRSKRARRLSIKVYPRGRVEVVAPRRTSDRAVKAFVIEHRDWIRKTRQSFAEQHKPEPFRLPTRIALSSIDRVFGVVYEPEEKASAVRYRQTGDIVRLSGATYDDGACVEALKRFLAATARKHFEPWLRRLSTETGNPFERMQVRGQKTCWGSHSSSGTISINYCLLFLDPALVHYLMIHELCHARHMDHSPSFWSLVGRFEPRYRRLDKRLSSAWRDIPTWVGLH
ncbi:MAG: SprT family zinc-dependent metalloprotease [Pseudomonadota bacterium]